MSSENKKIKFTPRFTNNASVIPYTEGSMIFDTSTKKLRFDVDDHSYEISGAGSSSGSSAGTSSGAGLPKYTTDDAGKQLMIEPKNLSFGFEEPITEDTEFTTSDTLYITKSAFEEEPSSDRENFSFYGATWYLTGSFVNISDNSLALTVASGVMGNETWCGIAVAEPLPGTQVYGQMDFNGTTLSFVYGNGIENINTISLVDYLPQGTYKFISSLDSGYSLLSKSESQKFISSGANRAIWRNKYPEPTENNLVLLSAGIAALSYTDSLGGVVFTYPNPSEMSAGNEILYVNNTDDSSPIYKTLLESPDVVIMYLESAMGSGSGGLDFSEGVSAPLFAWYTNDNVYKFLMYSLKKEDNEVFTGISFVTANPSNNTTTVVPVYSNKAFSIQATSLNTLDISDMISAIGTVNVTFDEAGWKVSTLELGSEFNGMKTLFSLHHLLIALLGSDTSFIASTFSFIPSFKGTKPASYKWSNNVCPIEALDEAKESAAERGLELDYYLEYYLGLGKTIPEFLAEDCGVSQLSNDSSILLSYDVANGGMKWTMFPAMPSQGTYILGTNNGVLTWVDASSLGGGSNGGDSGNSGTSEQSQSSYSLTSFKLDGGMSYSKYIYISDSINSFLSNYKSNAISNTPDYYNSSNNTGVAIMTISDKSAGGNGTLYIETYEDNGNIYATGAVDFEFGESINHIIDSNGTINGGLVVPGIYEINIGSASFTVTSMEKFNGDNLNGLLIGSGYEASSPSSPEPSENNNQNNNVQLYSFSSGYEYHTYVEIPTNAPSALSSFAGNLSTFSSGKVDNYSDSKNSYYGVKVATIYTDKYQSSVAGYIYLQCDEESGSYTQNGLLDFYIPSNSTIINLVDAKKNTVSAGVDQGTYYHVDTQISSFYVEFESNFSSINGDVLATQESAK